MTKSPRIIDKQHQTTVTRTVLAAAGTASWLAAGLVLVALELAGWGLAMLAVGALFAALVVTHFARLRRLRAQRARVAELRSQQRLARSAQQEAMAAAFTAPSGR